MKRLNLELKTILTAVLLSVSYAIQKLTHQIPKISSSYLEHGNRALKIKQHSLDRS